MNGDGRTLHSYAPEAAILTRITAGRASGVTLRGIAADLNGAGFTTWTGARFRHQNVAGTLSTRRRN